MDNQTTPETAAAAPAPTKPERKRRSTEETGTVYVLCYTDGTYSKHDKAGVTAAVQKPEKGKKIDFLVRGVPAVPHVETVIRLGS